MGGEWRGGLPGNWFPEPPPGQQLSSRQPASQDALHRYVDRVTEFLQQKLKQSQLLALKKELMVEKQQEALQEQAALEPKLDLLLEKTRELQKLVSLTGSLPCPRGEGGCPSFHRPRPCACLSAPCPLLSVSQIEADISKRYSGRPVNLMGTSL